MGGDELLHGLRPRAGDHHDVVGAAVVAALAVQPRHGGDVLLDMWWKAQRDKDFVGPLVQRHVFGRHGPAERARVLLGDAVHVECLRTRQLVDGTDAALRMPEQRSHHARDVGRGDR